MSNENFVGGKGASTQSKPKWLPCPICAGNPQRYKGVKKACYPGQVFESVARVNEHIRRYHSREAWCLRCHKNFPLSDQAKGSPGNKVENHTCDTQEVSEEAKLAMHTYLTEEQQENWASGKWKGKRRARDAKPGGVIPEHYGKLWKVFNPNEDVPKLTPPHDDVESSPGSSSSRSSTSGDSNAPTVGTKRKAGDEHMFPQVAMGNFLQPHLLTMNAQYHPAQWPTGQPHTGFSVQDQPPNWMLNAALYVDKPGSLPESASMTRSGGSVTHESAGGSPKIMPTTDVFFSPEPNKPGFFSGVEDYFVDTSEDPYRISEYVPEVLDLSNSQPQYVNGFM